MREKRFRRCFTFFLPGMVLSALFLSCTLSPSDPGYIPPGWSDPVLVYQPDEYTPAEVTGFVQAPGQYANDSGFGIEGNTDKLLGFPVGGGTQAPDHSSAVSLGMAGGSVTLRFEPPIENHPDNIGGYDFIVFGNAFWSGTSPSTASQEPGVIRVMKDENRNGEPDDTWYLIAGSHLDNSGAAVTVTYSKTDTGLPPEDKEWWPGGVSSPLNISDVFILPDSVYQIDGTPESCRGYCDTAPTLLPGDLSGADGSETDNSIEDREDYPEIAPVYFYTVPDDHESDGIDAGSGGGNAVKLEWAVDPDTFTAADLDEVTWIKIVSATTETGTLGEFSCEVDAVTRVRRSRE